MIYFCGHSLGFFIMKMNIGIPLFFLLCASSSSHAELIPSDGLQLELVQILFRHGARTPTQEELDTYSYLNTSAYEPWGLEVLTNNGQKQEYEFGSFLRNRYAGFLPSDYKAKDVYAYSSDSDRAKVSLELVLAGLYPLTAEKTWNPALKWSPIPYLYTPHQLDILLRYMESSRFQKLIEKVQRSDEYKKEVAKHSQFLRFVTERTGVYFDKKIKNAQNMYGVLASHKSMGLPLPGWFTPETKANFIKVLETVFDGYSFTNEMKKLGAGPIIKTFINNMNLNQTISNPRKIYLYSAHDGVVAAFIRAHNIQQFRYPSFGSGLLFEKYRDSKNRVYVRILSWDGNGKISKLKVGACKGFCPIEDYLKIVEAVVPSEGEINEMLSEFDVTKLKDLFFKDEEVKSL